MTDDQIERVARAIIKRRAPGITDAQLEEAMRGHAYLANKYPQYLEWRDMINDALNDACAAIAAIQPQWQPIETAPHEILVVLGWEDEAGVWKQDIALASAGERFANGYSNRWLHGSATHWMPLPAPPCAPGRDGHDPRPD